MEKNNIKVAQVSASITRLSGGVVSTLIPICNELSSRFRFRVFGGYDKYVEEDQESWGKIETVVSKTYGLKSFGYQPGLIKALCEFKPDIIHSHGIWMYSGVAGSKYSKENKIKRIITTHGMLDAWALNNSYLKKRIARVFYEDASLKSAHCIHALNEAEYLSIRQFGLKNPVAIIPNGVYVHECVDNCDKSKFKFLIANSRKILLFFGRLHDKKGLNLLIDSWIRAIKSSKYLGEKWVLAIAGWSDQVSYNNLDSLNKLYNKDQIYFLGPIYGDDKKSLYNISSAFILPSLSEGLPISVLEAWSFGVPTIISAQCNLTHSFESKSAISVNPDRESIYKAILNLESISQDELDSYGSKGRMLAANQYSWRAVSHSMEMLYLWLSDLVDRPDFVVID